MLTVASSRLQFRILGPLEVRNGGALVRIGGPKQRALLALLLLDANRVVSRDRLIEELLPGQNPESAERVLRVQISRLRTVLGSQGAESSLVSRPPGYVLQVGVKELDLLLFERLVEEGQRAFETGDHERAAAKLREAESLWRGRPLADLEFEEHARIEVERLEELRLAATEQRIEAELALGRHTVLVPELDSLVGAHPLRERLRRELMLALYRSGRQADALAPYRESRKLSVDELGLEPGRELKELEQAILRQDSALDLVSQPLGRSSPPRDEPVLDRRSGRKKPWIFFAGAALAVGAAAAGLAVWLTGSTPARPQLPGNGLMLVSTRDGKPIASVDLHAPPSRVASGLGSLWATESGANSVERVDARTKAVSQSIRVGDSPSGIAVAAGDVWVANTLDGTVSRIDASTNDVVQVVSVGTQPAGVLAAGDAIWVTDRGGGTVSRIDPTTGRVVHVVRVGRGPTCLAATAQTLWVCNQDEGTVTRIELRNSDVVDTIRVGDAPSAIVATARGVWLLDRLDSTVSYLDATSDAIVSTHAVGGRPSGLGFGGSSVWVSNDSTGRLDRIDPESGVILGTTRVGDRAGSVTATPTGLWVTASAGGPSHRGGTLRLVETTYGENASIDPAVQTFAPPLALQGLMNDGLVTLDHVSGPDGARLVPDLALSLPSPTEGGLTYTFRLRPDIRDSTGRTVQASDVRHSFERLFHPLIRSVGSGFFTQLLGADRCVRLPHRPCDLSRAIVPDDRSRTVTFHLTAPDPDFLFKLTLSFAYILPKETPNRPVTSSLPATGPYMVRSVSPAGEVVLVRNPRFREWSHAAQPSGYPDGIEWLQPRGIPGPAMAVNCQADLTPVLGSLGRDGPLLRTRYPSQLRFNWFPATAFWLQSGVRPMDRARSVAPDD